MNSEQDLINKLMISKKIMERHNQMGRGGVSQDLSAPELQNYETPNATYNLPNDILSEARTQPLSDKTHQLPTEDRIMNSKLPDDIKRLMMEHPIDKPTMGSGPTLSNELVEKASRLMGGNTSEQLKQQSQRQVSSQIDMSQIKNAIRETVEEVLKENGLLVESTTRSDEVFKFRVGNHLFEGKVTKIKKISNKD
jgi:hypothetical protein